MKTVSSIVTDNSKTLIVSGPNLPAPLTNNWSWSIGDFDPYDYQAIIEAYLPETNPAEIDCRKIYSFAPELNGHNLRSATEWLSHDGLPIDTDKIIDYLRRGLSSNVILNDLEQVKRNSLKGIDDLIESLETNIVLSIENDELADSLQLRPSFSLGHQGPGKPKLARHWLIVLKISSSWSTARWCQEAKTFTNRSTRFSKLLKKTLQQ